ACRGPCECLGFSSFPPGPKAGRYRRLPSILLDPTGTSALLFPSAVPATGRGAANAAMKHPMSLPSSGIRLRPLLTLGGLASLLLAALLLIPELAPTLVVRTPTRSVSEEMVPREGPFPRSRFGLVSAFPEEASSADVGTSEAALQAVKRLQ